MAATSGTFNLVEITKVEYGDADLVAGVVPSSLKTIGDIKEGQMNLDFPEASTTPEYSEQTQQPYRVRKAPVMRTATLELVTSLMTEVKDFLLTLCIFDTFSLEQAQALRPQGNSRSILKKLLAENAFITYDSLNRTYQLHNILTLFLREIFVRKNLTERRAIWRAAARPL